MNAGRIALVVTCVVVAGLATWLAIARWADANRVATVLSALSALAAIGVAVWAALRPSATGTIRATRTGKATAAGDANTGVRIRRGRHDDVRATRTGDAETTEGNANTGVQLD